MTLPSNLQNADWQKGDGLIPAIVQDAITAKVLMLGYMNEEALLATLKTELVSFYSRSRKQLWQKGETSGNILKLQSIELDCDNDSFLVLAEPVGSICHLGSVSCFANTQLFGAAWLAQLEQIIAARADADPNSSYTAKLLQGSIERAAQKVGEEGVEVALAAVGNDLNNLTEEAADLLYHLLIVLRAKGLDIADVISILQSRHKG
ncbi:MAG: bifunctional phosphoribosyl-AMP cyclohydrolase/phosphoribosyl-ATP diphosphatase HisIE [Robiginitomaculum sp.]|nr:bifunctional phosphoribosyl-AMP cyclohydrolase/phosphoribosyl-ATP diphosphatase HisIE [Robiginitomaculum sp.]